MKSLVQKLNEEGKLVFLTPNQLKKVKHQPVDELIPILQKFADDYKLDVKSIEFESTVLKAMNGLKYS